MTYPINPATGLPMTSEDYPGVDVGGSPFGTRLSVAVVGALPGCRATEATYTGID
ncbi:hypothetical protein [Pandoraea apista]|uniref:hypothetical protein n=1 Tax=Pandoraea apista TaxID=93218 RepID=UPI000657A525|nr:hypothetical protein [Pandoraea apista]CFB61451.1 hypothetical protein LMG16407_01510 [Pandoraea apista]